MDWLIGGGAVISFAGLCGIMWCIFAILRAKKANLTDDELKARLQKVVPINLASLLGSILGLMVVGAGILLG